MKFELPEYTIGRPLSFAENEKRKVAHFCMNEFISSNNIEDFEILEVYAGTHGAFVLRAPSFDWGIKGRVASISYEYDINSDE